MTKLTKHMYNIREKVDKTKRYEINEAITLLKELAVAKFVESVDVAVNLNINPRKSDQNIRGAAVLPHCVGRVVRVAVFAYGKIAEFAKLAGAEMVGMEDLVEQIKDCKSNFDIVIATPDTMHIVSQLGQILGPRGLMPNLKTGTITSDVFKTVKDVKSNQVRYRNDKGGIIHVSIGKINFEIEKLRENLESLLISLKKVKPPQIKGIFLKKVSISTTMGAGITIDQTSLNTFGN